MTRRQLRLAYLTTEYPKTSHTFIRREIEGLERRGHQVLRLSVRQAPDPVVDPADKREAGLTTYCLKQPPSVLAWTGVRAALLEPRRLGAAARAVVAMNQRSDRGIVRHAAYLAEACFIRDELRKNSIEHLHVHFGTNAAAVARLVRRLGGPPYSMTLHGPDEFDAPVGFSLGEKVAEAAFAVTISDFGSAQLRRWIAQEHWHKVHVVRCTVPDSFHEQGRAPSSAKNLVCVGRLAPQKGQLLLLEAVAAVAASGEPVKLVLVGDGEMRAAVERRISELDLAGRVSITGWADERQVIRHILESRAMVLPSFAEGLPVVIMEAMALRRPVVSTFVGGIPELVVPGKTGWLVPAGNVGALASALREVLAAPPERLDELGGLGQVRVREMHGAETELDKLEALFAAHTVRQAER